MLLGDFRFYRRIEKKVKRVASNWGKMNESQKSANERDTFCFVSIIQGGQLRRRRKDL